MSEKNINKVVAKNPIDLITPNRFDLLAKYIYARNLAEYGDLGWHRDLYVDHLKAFNGLVEADGSGKHGAEGFISSFKTLIAAVMEQGFDSNAGMIPLSQEGTLVDGAHRTIAALVSGNVVACSPTSTPSPNYNYQWFKERGLDVDWLDTMAAEVCRLRSNIHIVLIYPSAQGLEEELVSLIEKYCVIWYRKNALLQGNGHVNLMREVYRDEPWLGSSDDDFAGARNKAGFCFECQGPLRIFLVEGNMDQLLALKKEIRGLFRIGNHSVHINDTQEETIRLGHVLFNNNSIHFLNYAPVSMPKWFSKLFSYYITWSDSHGLMREKLCIDGSSVLAAYGLREARDLDFLHIGSIPSTGFKEISSHNHEAKYYRAGIDQLVGDPRHHFFCNGFKFLSLPTVQEMKSRRGELKDQEDVASIVALLSNSIRKRKRFSARNLIRRARPRNVVRELKFIALKLRFYFYVLRHKLASRANGERV